MGAKVPKYCVVYWESENLYSFESISNVQDLSSSEIDEINEGGSVVKLVKWGGQYLDGKIVSCGSRREMRNKETELSLAANEISFALRDSESQKSAANGTSTEAAISSKRKSDQKTSKTKKPKTNTELHDVTAVIAVRNQNSPVRNDASDSNQSVQMEASSEVLKLKRELAEKEAKLQEQKHENKILKRAIRKATKEREQDDDIEYEVIGGALRLPKSFVDYTKLCYRNKPSFFLRRMILDSNVFSLEEIAASSITGRASSTSPTVVRPRLDPVKIKIIKDFTMAVCNVSEDVVMKTLRQIPSDARARKKIKEAEHTKCSDESDIFDAGN